MEQHYKAHWCKLVIIMSIVASLILMLPSALYWANPEPTLLFAASLCLLIGIGAALFTIRGYTVTQDELLIQRLSWKTRISLKNLKSAQINPDAFRKCIRTCGNGGLFSFSGFYYSKSVGHFRALVTDLANPVVLRFEKRTLVISPSEPETFVQNVRTYIR